MMFISPRLHAVTPVPTPPVLAAEDQALAAAFVAALPQITQNIAYSVAAAAVATPPLPSDPSAKGFFRIRADWSVDSDGDDRFDWQELLLDGNSPYNADSDGDNIPDGEDPPVFQIGAAPAEPNRPPVAEFEHRYVEGLKGVSYLGTHIGVGGVANRSDGQSWTWGSPEFEAVILGQDFSELTGAAAALPIESPWLPGVMSMVATNLEDRNLNGDVVETEWANFKIEYRLKLLKPAPKGGYEIPLTLLKIPYKWEEPGDEWVPGVLPLGESQTITLTLAVPEGAEESTAVQLPVLHAGVNRRIVLVPADIAILEGNGTLPADGLCLQMGEAFRVDFNGIKSPANNCFIPDERITWQVSQLDAHGGFSEWEILQDGASQPVKGREVSALISDSYGCFRVRAVVSDGAQETIPFGAVRMRDATNAINGEGTKNPRLAAGQTEYLGVANCPIAEAVRDGAVKWLGSEDYAQRKNVPTKSGSSFNPDLTNKTKCNVFVTHVANDNGATTPYFYRNIVIPSAPIARDDWYFFVEKHVDLDGPGWNFVGVMEPPTTGSSGPSSEPPTPGMVAASRGLFDHGHCGILDYDGAWINAGSLTVNKFIHATHPDPKYTDYNLRMRIAP